MTFVVTDMCIQCKHTDCAQVCPVKCFHEGENFLTIDPDECIDCSLCVAECPVTAIYSEDDLPEKHYKFLEINARLAKIWPKIYEKKAPLLDATEWVGIENKLLHLIE